jgi:hypothetical protein
MENGKCKMENALKSSKVFKGFKGLGFRVHGLG